mgnify:CR=1 FL=1
MPWTEDDLAAVLARGVVKEVGSATPYGSPPTSAQASPSEALFLARVTKAALTLGWRVYHTHRSDHSAPGFPDLCMTNGERLLFAELKSATGKLTVEQQAWLDALIRTRKCEVYLWRPVDWETILPCLQRRPHDPTTAPAHL